MKVELLTDVNLSEIAFPGVSSKVVLNFLSMGDGRLVGSIVCTGLVVFSYHTVPGSELPQYVGEVNDTLISAEEVRVLLQRLCYGFEKSYERTKIPIADQAHHVHIEGGVVLEIVCTEVKLMT